MSGTVETIQEFPFHLLPTINGLGLKIRVPIEGIPLKSMHELLREQVPIHTGIIASLDEMSDMLLWIPFPFELLKFRRLVARRHL